MRPIKYRAFLKKQKFICDVLWIDFSEMRVGLEYAPDSISFFPFDDVELMQFTGLLDKNGKEIYEGDIVKVADKSICVVDFHAGQFVFNITNPDPITGGRRWCNESVYFNLQSEIIGNKFENPELLNQCA